VGDGQSWHIPGCSEIFLTEQLEAYAAAIVGNCMKDCLADIQRQYFKHFPIQQDHNVDPAPEVLSNIDDDAADPDEIPPNLESMLEDAFIAAQKAFMERRDVIVKCKEVGLVPCIHVTHHHAHSFSITLSSFSKSGGGGCTNIPKVMKALQRTSQQMIL
jgi:hypothetical protein